MEGRFRLGVLFVHGIGTQRPGDTLLAGSTALFAWLAGWQRRCDASVEIRETTLLDSEHERAACSTFVVRGPGQPAPVSFHLTECYWADAFHPPSTADLLRWCGRILIWAPVMFLLPWFHRASNLKERVKHCRKANHVSDDVRYLLHQDPAARHLKDEELDDKRHLGTIANRLRLRWLALLLVLPFVAIVGPLLALLFVTLVLLSLLFPADVFKSALRALHRVFSEVIGDSYFFVTSPVTRAAIRTRLQEDLATLAASCERVAIVAHSQGAAIAYDALTELTQRSLTPARTAFITYGSGIRRLVTLEQAFNTSGEWDRIGALTQLFIALELLAVACMAAGIVAPWLGAVVIILANVAMLVSLGLATARLKPIPIPLPLPWKDLYASRDPVPGGATEVSLSRANGHAERFYRAQCEVTNQRSVVFDHTTYWQATDDFVARVAIKLLEFAGVLPEQGDQESEKERCDVAAIRRKWRVSFLARLRLLTGVAMLAVLSCAVLRHSLAEVVQRPSAQTMIQRVLPAWADVPSVLGTTFFLAVVWGMYLVAASGWYAWDAREMNILVGGARWREQWRYPKRFIGGWSAIVTFVGVTIVWLEWPVDPMTRASWPVAATVVISLWALINARRGNGAYRSLEHRLQQLSEPPATVGV